MTKLLISYFSHTSFLKDTFLQFFPLHLVSECVCVWNTYIFEFNTYVFEFEQRLRDSEGQGSLASCSPWGLKELDMT